MTKEQILEYLKEHKDEFEKKFNIERIALFGSYARGDANSNSDIDIFVKMPPDLFKLSHLKVKIEEDLKKRVDIIREHKNIKPLFLKLIKEDMIDV